MSDEVNRFEISQDIINELLHNKKMLKQARLVRAEDGYTVGTFYFSEYSDFNVCGTLKETTAWNPEDGSTYIEQFLASITFRNSGEVHASLYGEYHDEDKVEDGYYSFLWGSYVDHVRLMYFAHIMSDSVMDIMHLPQTRRLYWERDRMLDEMKGMLEGYDIVYDLIDDDNEGDNK